MNGEGLASQAGKLTPRAQSILCLLALWVLEPVLSLDSSEAGRQAAHRAQVLYGQAWDAALAADLPLASAAEETAASSEELQLDEEPYDSGLYRLYFLAALLYALRSYTQDSQEDFRACLQRIGEITGILNSDGFAVPDGMGLDELMLAAVLDLEESSDLDVRLIEEVRKRFGPARDAWERALRPAGS